MTDFQSLKLPQQLIVSLYPNSLYAKSEVSVVSANEDKISFLGNNARRIAVLVNSPDTQYLPDKDLQFLIRILEACKLSLGDIALVNRHRNEGDFTAIREAIDPKVMILFGIDLLSLGLPIDFPEFKLQQHGGCTFLKGPAIGQLSGAEESAKSMKAKLWACLKNLFLQ